MSKFKQLCVWPGCILDEGKKPNQEKIKEFEKDMLENFNTRVKFLEQVTTNPNKDDRGRLVPNTGGRSDLFFAVHSDDISHFAVPRLKAGIRWWEDVLGNGGAYLYPAKILKKYEPAWRW